MALVLTLAQMKSKKGFSPEKGYNLLPETEDLSNMTKRNLYAETLGGGGERYRDSEREPAKGYEMLRSTLNDKNLKTY